MDGTWNNYSCSGNSMGAHCSKLNNSMKINSVDENTVFKKKKKLFKLCAGGGEQAPIPVQLWEFAS